MWKKEKLLRLFQPQLYLLRLRGWGVSGVYDDDPTPASAPVSTLNSIETRFARCVIHGIVFFFFYDDRIPNALSNLPIYYRFPWLRGIYVKDLFFFLFFYEVSKSFVSCKPDNCSNFPGFIGARASSTSSPLLQVYDLKLF